MLMASGLYLRPGMRGPKPATLRAAMPARHSARENSLFSRLLTDVTDPQELRATENKSPYPGIDIGCGSELLDFRFEDTEILQEREE